MRRRFQRWFFDQAPGTIAEKKSRITFLRYICFFAPTARRKPAQGNALGSLPTNLARPEGADGCNPCPPEVGRYTN
jgi:hypothetical protein